MSFSGMAYRDIKPVLDKIAAEGRDRDLDEPLDDYGVCRLNRLREFLARVNMRETHSAECEPR